MASSKDLPTDPLRPGTPRVKRPPPGDYLIIAEGTPGYFPRAELRDRSGVTQAEYLKLVQRGVLRARYRSRQKGWLLYTEEDVAICVAALKARARREVPLPRRGRPPNSPSYARTYSKEEAKKVFDLLRQGVRGDEIFFRTNLHPDTINLIRDEYANLSDGVFVDGECMRKINALPFEGVELPITTSAEILLVFQEITRPKLCSCCSRSAPSELCTSCERQRKPGRGSSSAAAE